jgi:glycosyltransferase involved in cell wall biosynthesis
MIKDRVAVVLSSYNGERYLAEQLESIVSQEGVDVTLLVRDDGSRDSSTSIVEAFASRYDNVKLIRGDNRGVTGSFFAALAQAENTSDYFAFSDQDDVWEQGKLAKGVAALRAERDTSVPSLYFSKLEVVDEQLRHIAYTRRIFRDISFKNALFQNIVTGCTVVMNRPARDIVLSAGQADSILIHDWWCYLAISALGRVIFDDKSAIKYRQHGRNQVGARMSFFGRVRSRYERTFRGLNGRFPSEQNKLFLDLYGQRLSDEQRRFMEFTLAAKRRLRHRITLAWSSEILMQTRLENALTRVGILLNRF